MTLWLKDGRGVHHCVIDGERLCRDEMPRIFERMFGGGTWCRRCTRAHEAVKAASR
jgi:hypothetical protein